MGPPPKRVEHRVVEGGIVGRSPGQQKDERPPQGVKVRLRNGLSLFLFGGGIPGGANRGDPQAAHLSQIGLAHFASGTKIYQHELPRRPQHDVVGLNIAVKVVVLMDSAQNFGKLK